MKRPKFLTVGLMEIVALENPKLGEDWPPGYLNVPWWLTHYPLQWFYWLGFGITVAIPMAIGYAIQARQDRKKK